MAWGLLGSPTDLVGHLLVASHISDAAAAPSEIVATACRHAPLLVFVILQLYAYGAGGTDAEESCSKALGFNESSGPKDRSNQDLQFCPEHHKRTCCERNNTRQVLSSFSSFSLDRSERCVKMSRLALCSVCDADVGVGLKSVQNLVVLCPSFCHRWFQSCFDDFFAPGGSGAGVQPCAPGSLVCSPLNEISQNASEFCESIGGFTVAEDEEDQDACYDGVPSARSRGRGPRAPWQRAAPPAEPSFWRRAMSLDSLPAISADLENYAPGVVVTFVVLLFGWYLWRAE